MIVCISADEEGAEYELISTTFYSSPGILDVIPRDMIYDVEPGAMYDFSFNIKLLFHLLRQD